MVFARFASWEQKGVGGESGSRTHEAVAHLPDFESGVFTHPKVRLGLGG